jgi:hypothetical protein
MSSIVRRLWHGTQRIALEGGARQRNHEASEFET